MNPVSTLRFILNHPLNRGRPVSTIARYLGWQVGSRLQKEVIVNWIAGTKLIARNGMTGASGNIYCGLHEFADMAFVLHALRPDDVFIDVGANIGSYTILASGVCGARAIAVEPDPGTARHLSRNIAANNLGDLVTLQQTAIGDRGGTVTFTCGRDTMNRVATSADQDVQEVALTRLDDILEGLEPTVIKLDVEGFETQVLRGSEETLAKKSLLAILLETVDAEALGNLTRHGFVQRGYDSSKHRLLNDGRTGGLTNELFVRDIDRLQEQLSSAARRAWRGREI